MAAKLICPDCGGTVGKLEGPQDTPCTCLQNAAVDEDAYRQAAAAASDAPADDAAVVGESAKVCRHCGADVTGKKRYKDTLGYWCVDCHKNEKQHRAATHAKCTSCGRTFPKEKLLETDVDRLCASCNRERIAKQRQMIRQAAKGQIHKGYEKHQLLILIAVAAVLLLLILLSRAGIL